MATICPKCGYERTGQEAAAAYECPRCGVVYAKYEAKAKANASLQSQTPLSPPDSVETKTCPFCAETVLIAAIKCKHCGERLPPENESRNQATTRPNPLHAILGFIGFIVVAVFLFGGSGEAPSKSEAKWFTGGALHNATVSSWNAASYENKLATAADWLGATKWKGQINTDEDIERLKRKAEMLVEAVDKVASDRGTDNMQIAEMATALIIMSNDLGP